jgi:hypothetical protein
MGAPALLDAQAQAVLDRFNGLLAYLADRVEGCFVTDGGTTQVNDAGGALPNIDLDVTGGLVTVAGVAYSVDAAADIDSTAGAGIIWGAWAVNREVICAVVADVGTGAVVWDIAPGTNQLASAGTAVAPTDAELDVIYGAGTWVRVANVTFTRTGDATITITPFDHTARPTMSVGHVSSQLAASEAAFNA